MVALASDENNPLPIFAAINSTISNTVEPERLSFVVLVTDQVQRGLASLVNRYVKSKYNGTRVSLCVGLEEHLRNRPAMRALVMLANSTRIKRKELLSTFNFAAFYLPHISKASRILYLDSDVIVRSDVFELAKMPMHGKPAAAVEDCSQVIGRYIDFDLASAYRRAARVRVEGFMAREGCYGSNSSSTGFRYKFDNCRGEPLPRSLPPNNTCVFNRGVLLLNSEIWLKNRLAEHIERYVIDFVHSRGNLFRSGVSQPPFLLALANDYERLNGEWNVRGLGRDAIGNPEWQGIASETHRFYPGFAPLESDLLNYMRIVAKFRRSPSEGDFRRHHQGGGLSWREQLLEASAQHPSTSPLPRAQLPPEFGSERSYRRSVLAALDAPPGLHRGAAPPETYKNHYPYVCPYAAHAKILHFNGEVKPWRMSMKTVTNAEPAEGALCLWKDISAQHPVSYGQGDDREGSATDFGTLQHGWRYHDRRHWCEKSVTSCVSSCALDWHRYVAGYVADLRKYAAEEQRKAGGT